ncbi:unnamed protein product [Symbiodinium natans]|uniref:FH2 domain-containing protein n=1 Tax=Symbiodinium natans TaxID=878477 RepID=A0A812SYH9_9DINO|nr:unnamed protein product [Symbiodinium natans]
MAAKGAMPKGGARNDGGAEADDWRKGRNTRRLQWQRLKASCLVDKTIFGEESDAEVQDSFDQDIQLFVLEDQGRRNSGGSEKAAKADQNQKEAIFDSKARQGLKIKLSKFLDARDQDHFCDSLRRLDLEALKETFQNEEDRDIFGLVVDEVVKIGTEHKEKLLQTGAKTTFVWDENCEGFCKKLMEIPFAKERLQALKEHLCLEAGFKETEQHIEYVAKPVEAVLSCTAFEKIMRRILRIGNMANTGHKLLGNAIGFDVVKFLEEKLYETYKPNGKTLLSFLNDHVCSDSDKEEIKVLAEELSDYEKKGTKEPCIVKELKTYTDNLYGQYSKLLSALKEAWKRRQDAQQEGEEAEKTIKQEMDTLMRYKAIVEHHRATCADLEAKRVDVVKNVEELLRRLAHEPAEKNCIGPSLAVIGAFAKKLQDLQQVSSRRTRARSSRSSVSSSITRFCGAPPDTSPAELTEH